MRIELIFDERFPDLNQYLPDSDLYNDKKAIDVPDELYEKWTKTWKLYYEAERALIEWVKENHPGYLRY